MKEMDMEYNSQRELLVIPEYGRNIQKLIEHAKTIEDPELKQHFIDKVVGLMMQMHPQNRNIEDYREKLWKHVFRIANYDLEGVMPPGGEIPRPEDYRKRPEMIGYPEIEARFRHYGSNVQKLIKKAIAMEDGPIKDGFVEVIGSYMKLAYKTWNKEHYVSDEVIKGDLESLSNGKLVLKASTSLDNLSNAKHRRKRSNGHQSGSNSGKYRSKGRRRKDRDNRDRDDRR